MKPAEPQYTNWYWWFAWRPVRARCGRWVWLKRIWRRRWFSPAYLPYHFEGFHHHIPTGWVEERAFL